LSSSRGAQPSLAQKCGLTIVESRNGSGPTQKSLPVKALNARHPVWQIPNAALIAIGESGRADTNEEFLAVLLDQLLNQSLRHLRPTLDAIIQRLANYLVKHGSLIFDHDCFDAGSTNIESDRRLSLHLDRFVEGKTRCNQKRLLVAQTDMIIRRNGAATTQ
jgi:hypothetical protein